MSSALTRGRTLNPRAVFHARRQRENRIRVLKEKAEKGSMLSLTRKERHELGRLTGSYPAYKALG